MKQRSAKGRAHSAWHKAEISKSAHLVSCGEEVVLRALPYALCAMSSFKKSIT